MVGSDEISFCKSPFAGNFCQHLQGYGKLTWLAGKWTRNQDKWGDFPAIVMWVNSGGGKPLLIFCEGKGWGAWGCQWGEGWGGGEWRRGGRGEKLFSRSDSKFRVSLPAVCGREGWKKIHVLRRIMFFLEWHGLKSWWWFQWGNDPIWRAYFSDGLKLETHQPEIHFLISCVFFSRRLHVMGIWGFAKSRTAPRIPGRKPPGPPKLRATETDRWGPREPKIPSFHTVVHLRRYDWMSREWFRVRWVRIAIRKKSRWFHSDCIDDWRSQVLRRQFWKRRVFCLFSVCASWISKKINLEL